ncbi:MAG TPA: hypothetical protein VMY88_01910 [Acidimicrobiales bacterium]|nr:hypothetical protein [Acidimicrobiales bacterium]
MTHKLLRSRTLVSLAALLCITLAACGDDGDAASDADSDATTTTAAEAASANTLEIEMVEYGYKVEGELQPGLATVQSRNSGTEWHMAGISKLRAGKTVEDVVQALAAAPPGGGEGEDDPLEGLIEEEQIDSPGHLLQPGASQSLTVDVLTEGEYVMLCFIPAEGGGGPHYSKGMVGGFAVAGEAAEATEPEADITVTLADGAEPEGLPEKLEPGTHTLALTATGEASKDFLVAQMNSGDDVGEFDTYFEEAFEGEGRPEKGAATKAPGKILANTQAIAPGMTVWMTLEIGAGETVFLSTTNPADDEEDAEPVDKTVTVTVS